MAAFFYGTLLHPEILKRVIGNDGSHLNVCAALLPEYTRHQVKLADYPGIVPYSRSKTMFDHELDLEERSVRGSLVTGLTAADMKLLDIFEGDEYIRDSVLVHPLTPLVSLDVSGSGVDLVPSTPPPVPDPADLAEPIKAATYVWCKPLSELRAQLWSFEEFVKYNAWKWVGKGAESNKDYVEIDRRLQMEGIITSRGEANGNEE
ncbi:hypothetical protein SERLA73DRAFT_181151 [Serpula lacrymans var. lacrymans S7.3]|uniref:Putative gamma-glutamylcyclotransferase n=2 Tax=Serpula lacrymans var. lacrymans TaxID=341189 RepID=F8PXJ4_SERL3|nr:uncharacterized protein SERLADRAFT_467069 [Serpula lacrymans var. lacrymans S7.9]EGN98607.1 hypothetical protein SERLA73DRAFT_181151 [Serpula lacrymans var. lacrymans S7.3]EGO24174.1 hypothetical protein SERLADRAFT_467069 [Serpula lacrymans var. lacrymans S7.9]